MLTLPTPPEQTEFLDAVRASLADGTLIRVTLGKHRGGGAERKCVATPVLLKEKPHVRFQTRRGTQELTENALPDAAIERLSAAIGTEYLSAVLFTTHADTAILYSKKRVPRLTRGKPTCTATPDQAHDRRKPYLVDVGAPYLAALGVTHGDGQVKPSMYAKFRQICRFVEIVDQLLEGSELKAATSPRIVDVGAGKGYLTFALHDHLSKRLGKTPVTCGIESNAALVDACNAVAVKCAMGELHFEARRAEAALAVGQFDVLIALHACDTATDDAILLGLAGRAALIICAPCCQHEIAPQLATRATPLAGLLKFGLLKQRQADLVTDAARALLLEMQGYEVRMIEFVSTEHTAKNVMIAAVRSDSVDRQAAAAQYQQLATLAGFTTQRLQEALRVWHLQDDARAQ